MRLLTCKACRSIEELPDYDGKNEVDPYVEGLIEKHTKKDPMAHGGERLHYSPFMLRTVDEIEWALHREQIIDKLNEEAKTTGFDGWAYESMNTYADDAMKCYSQHGRPKQGCRDYWSDEKRIGRPTELGKAVLKEAPKLGEGDPHLCQWCPVHTWVTTEVRFKKGMYKDN